MDGQAADDHTERSARSNASRPGVPRRREPLVIGAATVVLVIAGAGLVHRAHGRINRVALASSPRPVSVVAARATRYSDTRDYTGAVESWIEASVGPQYISAYVSTVVVRPGDVVRRGQVLATLDCAHPHAASRAVEMQAQAIDERQRAIADEAARERSMLGGGFIAPNQVEQTTAQSSAEKARLRQTRAEARAATLEVEDCALRAPFDGEVATRTVDPGAFVRPGATIVSIVDRRTVRVVVDAPERDFELVQPDAPVRVEMVSTGAAVTARISRRAPKADPSTRTIRVEVDIDDPDRRFPTATTALVHLDVGRSVPATRIPLAAATQRSGKAEIFVVEANTARRRTLAVLGERGGNLYFEPQTLPAGTRVVSEGRGLVSDGETVRAQLEEEPPPEAPDGGARGGGFGRPL